MTALRTDARETPFPEKRERGVSKKKKKKKGKSKKGGKKERRRVMEGRSGEIQVGDPSDAAPIPKSNGSRGSILGRRNNTPPHGRPTRRSRFARRERTQ